MSKSMRNKFYLAVLTITQIGISGCSEDSSTQNQAAAKTDVPVKAEYSPVNNETTGTNLTAATTEQVQRLAEDTPFAYVQRSIDDLAQSSLASYRDLLASNSTAPLDLSSPYDIQAGARLMVRSSLNSAVLTTWLSRAWPVTGICLPVTVQRP